MENKIATEQEDYLEASRNYEAVKHNLPKQEVKQVTSAQYVLISKILRSGKILDAEYRNLRDIVDKKVLTTYDASVFIEYVLGMLKFRRHFFNGKNKAYKKCYYCSGRNAVERYLHLNTQRKFWVCEDCAMNLATTKFVLAKTAEEKEATADLHRKYEHSELTSAQEDLVCSHREE